MKSGKTLKERFARLAIATVAAMTIWSAQAAAAPVVYTDRTSFNNAAGGGLSFESFESNPQLGESVTYGDLTFTESGGTNIFTNTALNSFFTAATTDGQHSIWYDDNDASISTVTFGLAGPITALGFDIATATDSTVTIGGDIAGSINLTANTPSFFGIIDLMSPFSSVTFSASGGPEVGFDAVSFGDAIPEPSTLILTALALVPLLAYARRRRSFS